MPKEPIEEGGGRRVNVYLPPEGNFKDFLGKLARGKNLGEPGFIALLMKDLYEVSKLNRPLESTTLWTILYPILEQQGFLVVKKSTMQQFMSLFSGLPQDQQQQLYALTNQQSFQPTPPAPESQYQPEQNTRRQESQRQQSQEEEDETSNSEKDGEGHPGLDRLDDLF